MLLWNAFFLKWVVFEVCCFSFMLFFKICCCLGPLSTQQEGLTYFFGTYQNVEAYGWSENEIGTKLFEIVPKLHSPQYCLNISWWFDYGTDFFEHVTTEGSKFHILPQLYLYLNSKHSLNLPEPQIEQTFSNDFEEKWKSKEKVAVHSADGWYHLQSGNILMAWPRTCLESRSW